MKKHILTAAAFIMALALLAGCGSSAPEETRAESQNGGGSFFTQPETEQDPDPGETTEAPPSWAESVPEETTEEVITDVAELEGLYTAQVDLGDAFLGELADELGMKTELTVALPSTCTLGLTPAGTFTFTFDEEAFLTAVTEYLRENGEQLLETLLTANGITGQVLDGILQAAGYDSFSAYAELVIARMIERLGSEQTLASMRDQLDCEGTFTRRNSRLVFEWTDADGRRCESRGELMDDGSICCEWEEIGEAELVFVR